MDRDEVYDKMRENKIFIVGVEIKYFVIWL